MKGARQRAWIHANVGSCCHPKCDKRKMMINRVCDNLWGKWRQPREYHPLICHLLDVASVATALSPNQQAILRGSPPSRTEESGLRSWVPFLISTHDIGKAAPAFQVHPGFSPSVADAVRRRLDSAGLPCPIVPTAIRHGTITAVVLPNLLTSWLGIDPDSARLFARIAAGHHGIFPTAADLSDAAMHPDAIGGEPWNAARSAIVEQLARVLHVPRDSPPPSPTGAAAIALAGLTTVSDWIGSIEAYFPYAVSSDVDPHEIDLEHYAQKSSERAERALRDLRWLANPAPPAHRSFNTIFPDFAPNDLQRAAVQLAESLTVPALVLIEAPMGEGKTEAAMYLAEAAAARLQRPGYYFALPTQATSNQMFSRVREFLERTPKAPKSISSFFTATPRCPPSSSSCASAHQTPGPPGLTRTRPTAVLRPQSSPPNGSRTASADCSRLTASARSTRRCWRCSGRVISSCGCSDFVTRP